MCKVFRLLQITTEAVAQAVAAISGPLVDSRSLAIPGLGCNVGIDWRVRLSCARDHFMSVNYRRLFRYSAKMQAEF